MEGRPVIRTLPLALPPESLRPVEREIGPSRRAGKVSYEDLKNHFHTPAVEAARELNICVTALKKICRDMGITRWPYRRIASLQHKKSVLQKSLEKGHKHPEKVQSKIDNIEKKIESLYADVRFSNSDIANKQTHRNFGQDMMANNQNEIPSANALNRPNAASFEIQTIPLQFSLPSSPINYDLFIRLYLQCPYMIQHIQARTKSHKR